MFLVVRPGAPSSVLAPSSDALVTSSMHLVAFLIFHSGAVRLVDTKWPAE